MYIAFDKALLFLFYRLLHQLFLFVYKVIKHLAKFEDELSAIWNKPKFVRRSNYVLTLNKLRNNDVLIKKIISHPGWKNQIREWKELGELWIDDKGEIKKKEWKEFQEASKIKKKDVLKNGKLNKEYKYLPLDTKHFGDLKYEILESFENLDKEIDGIIVGSDNYQALNTLMQKYKETVDVIYTDPPFNTGFDFLYKDNYQDSTWLSIMLDRIELAKKYLRKIG